MKYLVNEIIELDYNEIPDYDFPVGYPFGLITYINGVKYEFLIHFKHNSERLIIHSSGAIPGDSDYDRSRPYLNRWSWSNHFKESIIFYNDPTLYINDEIHGGYGVGTKDDYYLEKIAKLSSIFAKNQNLQDKDLLFYGSSAGGFTSFMLATMVKDSTAICDIPQFYLNELWFTYWDSFKKYIFVDMYDEEILDKFGYRVNVNEMMLKEKYIPNAILVLDCSVNRDFDMQYAHFFRDLNKLPFSDCKNSIRIKIHGNNQGHVPLSGEETMDLIEESRYIFSTEGVHDNILSELAELRKFKEEVLSSNSWKLTEPLRNKRFFRR